PFSAPFEIYQDSSGGNAWQSTNHLNRHHQVPVSFRGYRVRADTFTSEGLRATPVVAFCSDRSWIAVTVPQFWQNFPQAIDVSDGSINIRFLPHQYADLHEIQAGEQKTYECFIAFGPDSVTDIPLDWCRDRVVVGVDPSWVLSSDAIPFL